MAAIAVIAFTAYQLQHWPPGRPTADTASPGRKGTAAGARPQLPVGTAVAVLGDSFSAPSPATTGPQWPQILADKLHWRVYTDAVDGSGYVSPGASQAFGPRVPALLRHDPDLIIVAGGVGDIGAYPSDRIAKAADQVITRLAQGAPQAQIVVVSPFSNGEPGPLTREFSAKLRSIALDHHVSYVDATRWLAAGPALFAPDGTHPTQPAQQTLAQQMEQALRRVGLVEVSASNRAAVG